MNEPTSPQAIEAEQSVLGSVLIDPSAMPLAADLLHPSDFYRRQHGDVYAGMLALYSRGDPIDLVSLANELEHNGTLGSVGGPAYLTSLMTIVPTSAHVEHYAAIVAQKSLARRVIGAAGKMAAVGYEESNDRDGLLSRVTDLVYEVINSVRDSGRVFGPQQSVTEFLIELEKAAANPAETALDFGFADLDRKVGGLRRQEMIVLAARPSMGKTALAECIAENVAMAGKQVVFASVEMSRKQLLARRMARMTGISPTAMLRGHVPPLSDEGWWGILRRKAVEMSQKNIWIIDDPNATTSSIRADLSRVRMKTSQAPDLVVVDYLQILKDHNDRESDNSRVAAISRNVKQIAREYDCPVLALSQLSRESERRGDQRPKLSDLRDSGAVEQDADVVIGLHRKQEPLDSGQQPDGTTSVRVLKNRNGEVGTLALTFLPERIAFKSYQGQA